MKTLPFLSFGLFLLAVGCGSGASSDAPAAATSNASFAKVQTVLSEKCVACHGAANPKAGVALDSYEGTMKGGRSGPIVKAGDPSGSELVAVMRGAPGHKTMPPNGAPVSEAQIKTIEAWIQAGAKME